MDTFAVTLQQLQRVFKNLFVRYGTYAILTSLLLGTPSYFVYKSWKHHNESIGFRDLAEILERLCKAYNSQNVSKEVFSEIESDVKRLVEKHKNLDLHPYFLVCHAFSNLFSKERTMLDITQIQQILQAATTKMSCSNPFFMYYEIMRANILLSFGNSEHKKQGIDILVSCSRDKQHPLHALALYFHGLYVLLTGTLQAADEIWKPLMFDPQYQNSEIKALVIKAQNLE